MQQESIIPLKSPNDERTYQAVILPNGIKVLFVHDGKAEKGACSVSVGVGSLRDGERSLGLAHFLQHMLFMGSRKFPRHNQYSEFISLNSGMDNAWTSDDETNYYFQIANNKFMEGVERLSDFFVEALLTESCIEKERQAVHEECQLRCGEDNSRKWEILKHFASGPYHNHSIGNNETLSHPQVAQDLREFYQREYSANRINAVLLSALSIQEMKAKAVPFLLQIQNKKLPPIEYGVHFEAANLGKLVRMKSIKDQAIMQFFWVVQPLRAHYRSHPDKYITHVLGHQGKNSLLSLLKQREWASKITSYSHELPRQSVVGLEIQLTQAGVEQYEKVYNLVCDYCSWLKADRQVYEQIREASAVAFRFKEKSKNYSYSTELSSSMHHFPLQEVISWKAHYAQFDEELINSFLGQLNPFNLLLVYSNADQLENPIVQRYLGGSFLPLDLPKRVNEGTAFLPLVKNPFLPLDTSVVAAQATNSNVVRVGNVFFSRGKEEVCKGGVQLIVHSQQSEVFLEFYASFLELLFKETTYEAETLRLQAEYNDEDRISVSLFGFSDTVKKLLAQMAPQLSKIHHSQNAQSLFQLAREDLVQQYENFYCGDVDQIADVHLDIILNNNSMTIPQSLKELQGYEFEEFCEKVDKFWRQARVQWVVVGNFTQDIIPLLHQHEKVIIGEHNEKPVLPAQLCMKVDKNLVHATKLQVQDIATSACIRYHELGQYSEPLYYLLTLLVNYIKEPYFNELRTEKQLAYYLTAYSKNTRGALALCFILVSSNTHPRAISGHIASFCREFLEKAQQDLTAEKFESIKNSVRTKILEPHNSLKEYFDFVCREIDHKTFLFNRKDRECLEGYLDAITREDVIGLLRRSLERSLEVWVVAKNHEGEFDAMAQEFPDFEKIKSAAQYYEEWRGQFG